ncbi:MAG TPA: lipoyl(octanoyl) transferase LipB [Aurantimonas sp.]|uniref:Octanoyltransferase n=1 Tax=Aurantimonas marianensis TaxID=2920428 RepID=A0A9X2HCP3_9HYPH|nr:lipoyl(octanoyl) transferase LipB [Aurantimonas marianensis]MCP3054539.1 lipoyl(octanoyl) transferase LipB [Aurantimonas marianensis]
MTATIETATSGSRLATVAERFLARPGSAPVAWHVIDGPTPYPEALAMMEARVAEIASGTAPETVILLEHPPLYTAGTGARAEDLVDSTRFPVFAAGRGGEYTYHGPGQRVAYVLLDLKRRREDVRAYVAALEAWIIATLGEFQIKGERREDRVGVWVRRRERPTLTDGSIAEDKIAAIGIRVRRWVTFHGISLNVDPDLEHFSGIVPCGVRGHGVTSLADLGVFASMPEVDGLLRRQFEAVFGRTEDAAR